jgi:hypothetical protein
MKPIAVETATVIGNQIHATTFKQMALRAIAFFSLCLSHSPPLRRFCHEPP